MTRRIKGTSVSYELDGSEALKIETDGPQVSIFLNRQACKVLATILSQLASGAHKAGFHVHLKEDFGEEPEPDRMTLLLQ